MFLVFLLAPLGKLFSQTRLARRQLRRPTKGEYVLTTLGWAEIRNNLKLLPGKIHPFLVATVMDRITHRQVFIATTDFTLEFPLRLHSDRVYRNGLLQAPGVDYTVTDNAVRFAGGVEIGPQDIVQVLYQS